MSGLAHYFAQQYQKGTVLSTQDLNLMGYEQAVDNSGARVLRHTLSGIFVWLYAFDLSNPQAEETELVVFFHYTSEQGFRTMVDTANNFTEIWKILGNGVYTTRRDPAMFGSRNAVAYNNFCTAIVSDESFPHELSTRLQFVTHCIPVIVGQDNYTKAITHKASEMLGRGVDQVCTSVNPREYLKNHLSEKASHLMHELSLLLAEGRDLHVIKGNLEAMLNFRSNILALLRRRICFLMSLGFEHPTTLDEIKHLAARLQTCGDWESAEKLLRQAVDAAILAPPGQQSKVLDTSDSTLGVEHASGLVTNSNLFTISESGDSNSVDLEREVLDTAIHTLGSEHPSTLVIKSRLATTLSQRGDLEGARKLQHEVLDAEIRSLGPEHPTSISSKCKLAATLSLCGDLDGALKLEREICNAEVRTLGSKHPRTLMNKRNLANTLSKCGDLEGAEKLEREVLDATICTLGPDHPRILASQIHLAATLHNQGDLKGAAKLQREVLDTDIRILGAEHPSTLTDKCRLSTTLMERGDMELAEKLLREVLDTDFCGKELQQEVLGVEKLQQQVLETAILSLGPNHPSTLVIKSHYSTKLLQCTLKLQQEIFDMELRIFGSDHPRTLMSKSSLATTMLLCGDLEGMDELERKILDAEIHSLGPDFATGHVEHSKLQGTKEVLESEVNASGPEDQIRLESTGIFASALWELEREVLGIAFRSPGF